MSWVMEVPLSLKVASLWLMGGHDPPMPSLDLVP